jgi:hypothetical protein
VGNGALRAVPTRPPNPWLSRCPDIAEPNSKAACSSSHSCSPTASTLLIDEIDRLRQSYRSEQQLHPFETVAICVLPDHLHAGLRCEMASLASSAWARR